MQGRDVPVQDVGGRLSQEEIHNNNGHRFTVVRNPMQEPIVLNPRPQNQNKLLLWVPCLRAPNLRSKLFLMLYRCEEDDRQLHRRQPR